MQTLSPGKDAFHRVPDFARNDWDAVERVPTGDRTLLARADSSALARPRAPFHNNKQTTKESK